MNSLVKTGTGHILVKNLLVRATSWGRLRGLILYPQLEKDSAMFFVATKRVHTHGMLFPLDLYFFSRAMQLIGSQRCVVPWELPESPQGTHHILEIHHRPSLEPLRLKVGEQVSILWKIRQ
jgi:uncharacterized membrane protein (UPF0127 family)